MESLVDGVFAIAVTLLIVSRDVPQSFQEFINVMWTFSGFIITFTFLFMIWHAHYLFHRRYGMEDMQTIFLNSILIFLILFYIYPLKFLATVLIGEVLMNTVFNMNIDFGFKEEIFMTINMRTVMIIYGIGVCAIWGILGLLYKHAYNHRVLLNLNQTELHTTKETLLAYTIMSFFGFISIIIASIGPAHWVPISGWIYCGIGPAIYCGLTIMNKKSK